MALLLDHILFVFKNWNKKEQTEREKHAVLKKFFARVGVKKYPVISKIGYKKNGKQNVYTLNQFAAILLNDNYIYLICKDQQVIYQHFFNENDNGQFTLTAFHDLKADTPLPLPLLNLSKKDYS